MANTKNQNKIKQGQSSQGAEKDKEGSSPPDSRQQATDPDDYGQNDSDMQKAALLSALNIETRRGLGEEEFDEDAADEEDDDDD